MTRTTASVKSVADIRADFPALARMHAGLPVAYFDGPGGTQVPAAVSDRLPERGMDPGAVLLALLGSANLSSRRVGFQQYDSTVGADTVAGPGRGAAVLRVKGTRKALVATTDGNQTVGIVERALRHACGYKLLRGKQEEERIPPKSRCAM